jgi:hypothetical protein
MEFTETKTYGISKSFTVEKGQTGYVAYTPRLRCVYGKLSGCSGASDQQGSACTPQIGSNGQPVGLLSLVEIGKHANATDVVST